MFFKAICGEPHPSINRADLPAVRAAQRISTGNLIIRKGSAFVVQGFVKGKEAITAAEYEVADIWRDAWRLIEEMEVV